MEEKEVPKLCVVNPENIMAIVKVQDKGKLFRVQEENYD